MPSAMGFAEMHCFQQAAININRVFNSVCEKPSVYGMLCIHLAQLPINPLWADRGHRQNHLHKTWPGVSSKGRWWAYPAEKTGMCHKCFAVYRICRPGLFSGDLRFDGVQTWQGYSQCYPLKERLAHAFNLAWFFLYCKTIGTILREWLVLPLPPGESGTGCCELTIMWLQWLPLL